MKKIIIKKVILILLILLCLPTAYAVQDTHTTTLTISPNDNFAPTIPTGLVATAQSDSEIDLIWNASTDDVGVVGYRVRREGIIIASTTSLFYSNTGLTAETAYDYTVEAFDSVPRYSGESAIATATTTAVAITPVTPTTPSVSGGSHILTITNLNVLSTSDSAIVSFLTNQPTQTKVYWGITPDYEMGSIAGIFYSNEHSVKIEGLNPDTRYYFRIEVINTIGVKKLLDGSFISQKLFIESLLTNVRDFKATAQIEDILLTWKNPSFIDFDSVRIVKSEKFFPRDISDGQTIYIGAGESFLDKDVEIGKTYYYSIFAKDKNGNYSSGALAMAKIGKDGEVITERDPFEGINVLENVNGVIKSLSILDFDFIQNGRKLVNIGGTVVIDGGENLTISLAYEKIPEILKTIAFTLIDPEDSTKVFPFLLRVNKDKTAYEATLAPLGKSGKYEMKIIILDYKNQGLKRLEGSLRAFAFGTAEELLGSRSITKKSCLILFIILLILIVLAIVSMHRNRKEKNELQ